MKSTIVNQTTTKERIINYYEKAGLDYAAWSQNFNMHFGYFKFGKTCPWQLEKMLNQLTEEVRLRLKLDEMADPWIFDLGCGLGSSSRYMATKNTDAHFYGITITPWQIEFGKGLTEEAGMENQVSMIQADYSNIPVADGVADAAFAMESSCYAKGADKKDFVDELYRILRPGGRFVVTDGFRKNSRPLPNWLNKIYRNNLDGWALTELADINLFAERLREAGFRKIKIEDVSWRVAPSFAHIPFITLRFFWSWFFSKNRKPLSKERIENATCPLWGMLMGLARNHFSYYIISGEK